MAVHIGNPPSSDKTFSMGEVARIISIEGIGRTKLFEILRNEKVLMVNNYPYQRFIDQKYFKVGESENTDYYVTRVLGERGINFVKKIVVNHLNKKDNDDKYSGGPMVI